MISAAPPASAQGGLHVRVPAQFRRKRAAAPFPQTFPLALRQRNGGLDQVIRHMGSQPLAECPQYLGGETTVSRTNFDEVPAAVRVTSPRFALAHAAIACASAGDRVALVEKSLARPMSAMRRE